MKNALFFFASFGVMASAFMLNVEPVPTGMIIFAVGFAMLLIWALVTLSGEGSRHYSASQSPKQNKVRRENKIKTVASIDTPMLSSEKYEKLCLEIDTTRNKNGIRKAFMEWSSYYQGGVNFVYEALKTGNDYRTLFNMSKDKARKNLFGENGVDYQWHADYTKVKQRYQYKLSLSFYQHMGVNVPTEISELIESLTQMLDDEAAIWSRRKVGT